MAKCLGDEVENNDPPPPELVVELGETNQVENGVEGTTNVEGNTGNSDDGRRIIISMGKNVNIVNSFNVNF